VGVVFRKLARLLPSSNISSGFRVRFYRIGLHVAVTPVGYYELSSWGLAESLFVTREKGHPGQGKTGQPVLGSSRYLCKCPDGRRTAGENLSDRKSGLANLKLAMEKQNLSAKAYGHILNVSRTIADLDEKEEMRTEHLAEAPIQQSGQGIMGCLIDDFPGKSQRRFSRRNLLSPRFKCSNCFSLMVLKENMLLTV
jgi:hypothetical protein